MTYPRSHTVRPGEPGVYHCVSRCVRRAFLCGVDALTGRSFEHRRQWIEDRIVVLGQLYALAVHSHVVLHNHLHVVVELDPATARAWSDEEVARRWLSLTASVQANPHTLTARLAVLLEQPERIAVLRERLGSLSWFMRHLKEPIARWANREDDVKGHFWEARFDSQDLLDDPGVLTCMAYVDLNPIRAGLAHKPEDGPYTSLHYRIRRGDALDQPMVPVATSISSTLLDLTTGQYLELVDWTGRNLHQDNAGSIPPQLPPILQRLRMNHDQWLGQVPLIETGYRRAVGRVDSLRERARQLRQKWIRGIGTARRLERPSGSS